MATSTSQTPTNSITYSKDPFSSQTPSFTSSSTPPDPTVWDVFLSFRGAHTRLKFVTHLYNALDYHGIRTYKDTPELRTGEVISDALIQAIHDSKVYIVVFSENYASSSWCLDELVEIYRCYQQKKRLVISVYYDIDPSVVRYQIKSFEQFFEKHEKRYACEKVQKWRNTLENVAGFSGQPVSAQSDEGDIINEIVEVILLQLKPKTLYVADYPVGLDSRVKDITTLLSSDIEEGVIIVGLHGMGGVGKTTLAKALYNKLLEKDFKASSFLANVRDISVTTKGMESLQQQLIDDVLKSKKQFQVHNVDEGIMFIKERICSRKILVFIDDIDKLEQYKYLIGPFAPGSIVIVTTRDEDILDKIKVEGKHKMHIHGVEVLDDAQSVALFSQHAFRNSKGNTLMVLFKDDILRLSGRLPLALQIFGSYLSTHSKVGWEDYIKKLQLNPNSTIQERLIISLDAMDDLMLKNMFIDIACFFNGSRKEEVVKIMETYYSINVDHNIHILKKRSLLTITRNNELRMHDLLRDMGREVARNKCPDEPGKYSRLWLSKDICDVLEERKGKKAIEGIIPSNFNYHIALKGVEFSTKTFKKMNKLRFLYMKDVNLTGSFDQRFEGLTWLRWDCCPLECLPSEFWPKKLLVLELRNSNIRMWELNKVFEKLKTLDMSYSINLSTTPDFSKLPCIEDLNLEGCTCLEEFKISNQSLTKLVSVNLSGCHSLNEIHISTGSLMKLVSFNVSGCVKLRSIHDSSCSLKVLRVLNVSGCDKLETLPDQLWKITSLKEIHFGPPHIVFVSPFKVFWYIESDLTSLPSIMSQLLNVEHLCLTKSYNLVSIEQLPPNVIKIDLSGCMYLERLPDLSNLKQLEELDLTNCSGLTQLQGLEGLTSLRKLRLKGCNSSLLTGILTKRFFQICSGCGHKIEIYIKELPRWILSCEGVDHIDKFPPNLLAIIFCLEFNRVIHYYNPNDQSYNPGVMTSVVEHFASSFSHSNFQIIIVPTSIMSNRTFVDILSTPDSDCTFYLLCDD